MKATAEMIGDKRDGYFCIITIEHDLLMSDQNEITTEFHKGKGELRRKVIQFCAALNLDLEWI